MPRVPVRIPLQSRSFPGSGPSFESVGEATEDDDSVLGDGAPKAAQLSRSR